MGLSATFTCVHGLLACSGIGLLFKQSRSYKCLPRITPANAPESSLMSPICLLFLLFSGIAYCMNVTAPCLNKSDKHTSTFCSNVHEQDKKLQFSKKFRELRCHSSQPQQTARGPHDEPANSRDGFVPRGLPSARLCF